MSERVGLRLKINGEPVEIAVPPHKTLLEVLREDLGLTGTKHGCELGECGACTVLVDGEPVLSCLALPVELEGREILTIEGLTSEGAPHPLQTAFAEMGAAQCGYCTPGILLASKALLDRNEEPTREEIKESLSGNLCRCTGYHQIFDAVELAARRTRESRSPEATGRNQRKGAKARRRKGAKAQRSAGQAVPGDKEARR
jgi:carbon-monoxide dehydrogenase small subunit